LSLRNFNFSRETRGWGLLLGWALVIFAAVCPFDHGWALDPGKATSQYKADYWNAENGFPGGQISSFAQTPDGYLWIGTDTGLVRFDGLSFLPVRQTESAQTPLTDILGLMTDDDGDLWAQTQNLLLVRAHQPAAGSRATEPQLQIDAVTVLFPGLNDSVLMSSLTRGILRYKNGQLDTLVSREAFSRSVALSIAETADGKLWVGTRDDGLLYFDHRGATAMKEGLPDMKINTLLPTGDGGLWIGTDNGLARWNGGRIVESGIPPSLRHVQVLTMLRDRDGNVWVGTKAGLVRLNSSGSERAETRSAPSERQISAIFEDREGNLWVGDGQGLERIRDSAFVTYSTAEGLPSESNGPIYVGPDARAWIAPTTGGLWWMKDGKVVQVEDAGIANDVVYSIAGNRNDVWIGRQTGGLTHLSARGNTFDAQTYTKSDGLAQNSVYSVRVERDGTVWAGTLSGGVSRLKDGRFKTYTTADGLASNVVTAIEDGQGGSMWFGTSRGLSEWSNGRWRTFTSREGLPSQEVISLLKDSSGILWIGTANGLSFLSSDRTHISGFAPQLLREPVFGMAEDASGYLWISTASHVLRASRERLLSGQLDKTDIREYGISEGLQGTGGGEARPVGGCRRSGEIMVLDEPRNLRHRSKPG
jgi:ligand-binding sensor domain-containing protein